MPGEGVAAEAGVPEGVIQEEEGRRRGGEGEKNESIVDKIAKIISLHFVVHNRFEKKVKRR